MSTDVACAREGEGMLFWMEKDEGERIEGRNAWLDAGCSPWYGTEWKSKG